MTTTGAGLTGAATSSLVKKREVRGCRSWDAGHHLFARGVGAQDEAVWTRASQQAGRDPSVSGMFQRALALDQDHVRYARRLYRLTTPRTIKAKTINSETKVRIPQMIVTLLLRTAASSLLKSLVTRLATLILPK